MAYIENRSPFVVEVPLRPDLLKQFSINEKKAAQAYCTELATGGHPAAALRQLETKFLVVDQRAGLRIAADTRAQAVRIQAQLHDDSARDAIVDPSRHARLTFGEAAESYLSERVPHSRDANEYARRVRALVRNLGLAAVPLVKLSHLHFAEYIRRRRRQVTPWTGEPVQDTTIARELAIASAIINRARTFGLTTLTRNPVVAAKMDTRLRCNAERDRVYDEDEVEAIDAMLGRAKNAYPRWLFRLMLVTGCRPGSLLALQWSDVHLDERYMLLRKTKNGRLHKQPLLDAAVALLQRIPSPRDGRVLPISEETVERAWNHQVLAAAGVLDAHLYDARATFLTRLARTPGISTHVLLQFSSHRDMRMLQRYLRDRPQDIVAVAQDALNVHRTNAAAANAASAVPSAAAVLAMSPDAIAAPVGVGALLRAHAYIFNGNRAASRATA